MTSNNLPDELHELWPDLVERKIFPYTHRAVPEDQRTALRGEYERANSQFHRVSLIPDRANDNVGAALVPHANGLSRSPDGAVLHSQPSPGSGDSVSLNPQPLPPKSAAEAHAQALPTAAKGTETSIIIVSGEPGKPVVHQRVRKTPAPTIDRKIAPEDVQH